MLGTKVRAEATDGLTIRRGYL